MRKLKPIKQIVLLAAVVCAAGFILPACVPPITEEKIKERIASHQEIYQQKILDHFAENEGIFNKIIETFAAFEGNADDFGRYKTVSLINDLKYGDDGGQMENNYVFFTARTEITGGEPNTITERIDFLSDKTYNIHGIKEEELNKVLLDAEDYGYDSGKNSYYLKESAMIKYNKINYNSENYVVFESFARSPFEKADIVSTKLIYDKSGAPEGGGDNYKYGVYKINDCWYIEYYYYAAPLI